MNDFLISFLTACFVFAIISIVRSKPQANIIKYRQSHIHKIISPFLPDLSYVYKKNTQSQKHLESNIIDVLITGDSAYWVHKNIFYRADVEDGEVDRSTASPVNTESMSPEEVSKMLVILDKLKSRKENENRGTRDK